MCEFNVFVDGEKVFEDVIYAEENEGRVVLRNILGESREEQNYRISKVDVSSAILVLSRIGSK